MTNSAEQQPASLARHFLGVALEEPAEHLDRRGQVQPLGHALAVHRARALAEKEEAALRLDGSSRPEHETVVTTDRRVEHHGGRGAKVRRSVDHEADGALRSVLAEQDHRPREIGVDHLGHREEQRGCEGPSRRHAAPMLPGPRHIVNSVVPAVLSRKVSSP